MHAHVLTILTLTLSLLHPTLAKDPAPAPRAGAILTVRQTAPETPAACLDYRITATNAIIGANTTYRSAYLSQSNVGTLYDFRMFDAAIAKLPSLTTDRALNEQCGNLTAEMLVEAASNFTVGTVGPFTDVPAVGILAGPIIAVIVSCVCAIFGITWMFMP